jgi:hypothetical protein
MEISHEGLYCYMFKDKPKICRLNNAFGKKNVFRRDKIRKRNFSKNYVSQATIANILIQSEMAKLQEEAIKKGLEMKVIDGDCVLIHEDLVEIPKKLTAKIQKISCGGSAYFADCPYCGKTKILGNELNTMSALCDKGGCHRFFNLEH